LEIFNFLNRLFPRAVWANILDKEAAVLDSSLFVGRYAPNYPRRLYSLFTNYQPVPPPFDHNILYEITYKFLGSVIEP